MLKPILRPGRPRVCNCEVCGCDTLCGVAWGMCGKFCGQGGKGPGVCKCESVCGGDTLCGVGSVWAVQCCRSRAPVSGLWAVAVARRCAEDAGGSAKASKKAQRAAHWSLVRHSSLVTITLTRSHESRAAAATLYGVYTIYVQRIRYIRYAAL